MKIRLKKALNYINASPLISTRPKGNVETANNSAQYPIFAAFEAADDAEQQAIETDPKKRWVRNAEHPGGFPLMEGEYEVISGDPRNQE